MKNGIQFTRESQFVVDSYFSKLKDSEKIWVYKVLEIIKMEIKKKIKLYLSTKKWLLNLNITIRIDKIKNRTPIGTNNDNKNIPI